MSYVWILTGPGVSIDIDKTTTTFMQGQIYDYNSFNVGTDVGSYDIFVKDWKNKNSVTIDGEQKGGQVYLCVGTGVQTVNLYFNENTNKDKIQNLYTQQTINFRVYWTTYMGYNTFDYDKKNGADAYTHGSNFVTFPAGKSAPCIIIGMDL